MVEAGPPSTTCGTASGKAVAGGFAPTLPRVADLPPVEAIVLGRRLIGIGAALGLAGCGFQPMYMPTASGGPGIAARELAAIDVPIIGDRPGQLMRQALQRRFANDSGTPKRYELGVAFWIAGEGLGIQPDNSATRVRFTGYASWVLMTQGPARTRLTDGTARTMDGMNIFNQQYFALDLENEVLQRRMAEVLADQVATQLSLWFRERAAASAAG
jgi:LPS-assembly lipoprotein